MQNSDFYFKISNLLKEKKITQTELAEKIGITQAALSKILSGNMATTVTTARKIAKALDVSVSYLLEEENGCLNKTNTKNDKNTDLLIKLIEEQNRTINEMSKRFETEVEFLKSRMNILEKNS